MKIFKLYFLMFKFEHSINRFDYNIKRRKVFFLLGKKILAPVALVTIIPDSSYSLMSLETLSPRAVQYICYKAKKLANI